ncbi:MAG: TadE family protein [Acidobacteriota bacterium]
MKRNQRGQTLIEGTLVMLVFFALLLGVVDFGQVLFSHQSLVERVRASVRWGSLHPDGGVDPVRNMVLYGTAVPNESAKPYLGMKPENVVVEFQNQPAELPMLHVEIVNYEAQLFAPWWSADSANHLVSRRPVSASAPVTVSVTP